MKIKTFKKSALIVIDMQKYFLLKGARAYLNPPKSLIPNATKLIEAFRAAKLPVLFTRHAHKIKSDLGQMGRWWNGELPWENDGESELIDDIVPQRRELVITKTKYSAFEGTKLDSYLSRRRVETIVLCGVMTNLCVETTARHAFLKDYQPVIVADACATKDMAYHRASLLNLAYGFAFVEKTNKLIRLVK